MAWGWCNFCIVRNPHPHRGTPVSHPTDRPRGVTRMCHAVLVRIFSQDPPNIAERMHWETNCKYIPVQYAADRSSSRDQKARVFDCQSSFSATVNSVPGASRRTWRGGISCQHDHHEAGGLETTDNTTLRHYRFRGIARSHRSSKTGNVQPGWIDRPPITPPEA